MKYVYAAVLEPEGEMYNVSFPDLPGCYTCGEGLYDALYMASDALNGWLGRREEEGKAIPPASDLANVAAPEGCIVSLVCADTERHRRVTGTKVVWKDVSLPAWLNNTAEAQNVNYSQVLQQALPKMLEIED